MQKFFRTLLFKIFFSSKSCFSKHISFFKIILLKIIFLFKIWRVVNFSVQNLTRCKNFNSESDTLWKIFAELWFYRVFRGLIDWWFLLSTLIPTYFKSGEVKDNACFWFSRQMLNWKLPHVSSLLNVWGIAKWQHTIFTEPMEKTLWSIKSSRSAVFLKIHICESKENALYLEFYQFSPRFLCGQQKEEERWKEKLFLLKIWRVVKFLFQYLTGCKNFNSEFDTL